jgi:hypothetical protein
MYKRCDTISFLVQARINVKIWGNDVNKAISLVYYTLAYIKSTCLNVKGIVLLE